MLTYSEMAKVHDGPSSASGASEERQGEEPCEEEKKYVGGPHARILEPRSVLVEVRRRGSLHIIQASRH